jgi:ABC-type bacteriocin/lantibiotic exporter with double-glycine peptidase domain
VDGDLNWERINFFVGGMGIVVAVSSVFVWIRATTFNSVAEKISLHLKYDLFYYLINKDTAFFDETKVGDMLSRIS